MTAGRHATDSGCRNTAVSPALSWEILQGPAQVVGELVDCCSNSSGSGRWRAH